MIDRIKGNLSGAYGRESSIRLDAMLGAIAQQLEFLGTDIDQSVAQLTVTSSYEDWADFWGETFGVQRRDKAEIDALYTDRIIDETIRQRSQPHALVEIVQNTLGIGIVIRDLWNNVLHTDAWNVSAGRPIQKLNGHLLADQNQAARLGFAFPYVESTFGVWLQINPGDPFDYTIENIQQLLPQMLFTNDFAPGSLHTLNGHLTSLDLGGPTDTAKYLFQVLAESQLASVAEVMELINRHRAAGTEAVFMGFEA